MVIVAKPAVEVEVLADTPEGSAEDVLAQTQLAAYVKQCWERAKFAKQPIIDRLLRCERQRRGVYDPEKAQEIAATGGSDIYMMLTDIKCHAASSWIKDVMLSDERQFDLEPAREPAIPPEVSTGIVDLVTQEAQEFIQTGQQMHPETYRTRIELVHDQVMIKLRDEAKDAARRMADKIDDQLHTGKFREALIDFIDDFVTYPTAVMKGPVVKRRKHLEWGEQFQPVVVSDMVREFERVSPFDVYPSPNSSGPQDGYLIQRHRLSRKELQTLRGVPGYSTEDIDQVLERFGDRGLRNWLMGDQERDNLEGKPHSRMYNDGMIEALEFWGTVSGHMLQQWGMKDPEIDEHKEYEANVWLIGPYVIKAIINPDPLGTRPYFIASWRPIPGAFWSVALPEVMRDMQTMCNASARALQNNLSIASGPQVDVAIDRLPDGEDITSMYPWKIWQTTSDRTGGGASAVKFFQPEMRAAELLTIYQSFSKQADEITGIPNYVYGSNNVSGAGRTASGLSMLMDNASKGIKNAIAMIDTVVAGVVTRLYNHNMMYDPDVWVKGDFRVVASGALGIVQKEHLHQRRNEFLQATANQIDMQIIGMEGRAYLLREVASELQMDTDKIVPDLEVIKFKAAKAQEEQAKLAMAQQAMQQQAAQQGVVPQPPQPQAAQPPQ